ncbi:MAG: hypothetical protein PUC73_04800 [Lachnospiraceae bacterium]|nr:hypothetical protein [Lachnospiraceae bacterium]
MTKEVFEQKSWKDSFTKDTRPVFTDLEAFIDNEVYRLFRSFAECILQEYDLRFGIPVWNAEKGWTYRIGKAGVYLITGIQIKKDRFIVEDIEVGNLEQYNRLLTYIKELYENNKSGFLKRIEEKNLQQRARSAERIAREKQEAEKLKSVIIPEKYNFFRWPAKLDISRLNRLYLLDAKGIQDEELADEIGVTLYLRCKYGKEDMERMEKNSIRCHGCGEELVGVGDFRQCKCGLQYSYKEYRRSYRRNNMPTGAAAKVFLEFIRGWEKAKTYQEKIILIDTLLHEFHLSLVSGATHRPVAMNFIDGSRSRVEEIISNLAR